MLPAPPKSLGRLGDVLISALQAVRGETNALGLSSKRSLCIILVDGLGTHNLSKAAGHARFLNSQKSLTASCWFPATTSVSITSFATAKHPVDIGFIGYQVFDRSVGAPQNLLSGWKDFAAGQTFQDQPTVSEMAFESGVAFYAVAPSSYEFSGFTGATMRKATYHAENSVAERFRVARKLLLDAEPKVIYLYIPELDQIAHALGSESTAWLNQLEEIDSLTSELARQLPKHAGLVLTADHGVIDIKPEAHIYLDELLPLDQVEFVGGDTRAPFIYLKRSADVIEVRKILEDAYGSLAFVVSPEDLITAGYWVHAEKSVGTYPDLVLIARKEVAFYHKAFAKKKSLEMVGHHGALTSQEMSIPIITFGF